MLQSVAQLITLQLIRREQSNKVGVLDENLINELSNRLHRAELFSFRHAKLSPVWKVRSYIALVDLRSHAKFFVVRRDDGFDFVNDVAIVREEIFWLVRRQPLLQSLELLVVLLGIGKRNLVRMERPLNELTVQFFRSRPPLRNTSAALSSWFPWITYLWRPQYNHRPSRLHDWLSRPRSLLDLADFLNSPKHRAVEVIVDVIEVLNNAHLVPVARKQANDLPVVHTTENRALADLEAIDVQDWKHRP